MRVERQGERERETERERERERNKVKQAHTGIDTTGMGRTCLVLHLPFGYSQYKCIYHRIMIMSRKERKLDHLKMNSKGATNKSPTCVVPIHAPQTNSH